MMNVSVKIDWRFVVALGVAVSLPILASRVDGSAAERVLTNIVGACRDCAMIANSNC